MLPVQRYSWARHIACAPCGCHNGLHVGVLVFRVVAVIIAARCRRDAALLISLLPVLLKGLHFADHAPQVHRATPLPFLDPAELSPGASGGDGGLAGGGGRGGPPGAPPAPAPLSLTPLPGYLLLTRGSLRALFNVTGLMRAGIPTLAAVDGAGVGAWGGWWGGVWRP